MRMYVIYFLHMCSNLLPPTYLCARVSSIFSITVNCSVMFCMMVEDVGTWNEEYRGAIMDNVMVEDLLLEGCSVSETIIDNSKAQINKA